MPGSPPTRIALAATSPPPSTRSNSPMPVSRRGGGSTWPSRPTKATLPPGLRAGPGRGSTRSSTMVFHSPQASHLPDHFGWALPQAEQTNRLAALAMAGPRPPHRPAGGSAWQNRRQ